MKSAMKYQIMRKIIVKIVKNFVIKITFLHYLLMYFLSNVEREFNKS